MSDTIKNSAAVQEQLRAMAEAFSARVARELPELLAQARGVLSAIDPDQRKKGLHAIRDELHKLAGAAGTFGFAALGTRARTLEVLTDEQLRLPAPDPGAVESLLCALTQLAQQAQEQQQPQPQEPSRADVDGGAALAAAPRPTHDQSRRVALIDCDPESGEHVRRTLGNFGYAVRHYGSPAALEAVLANDQLDEDHPDVLVLDIGAAGQQQGLLAYAEAMQQRRPAPLPLIVTGGHADDFASQLQAVRAGATGYFTTPLDIPKLESRLERCFAQQQGEPYRVLIVDDDRALAQRYALVLQGANMLVELIHDPAEVFASMRRFHPEVMLLDVHMPACSGPELAQMLRLNDDWLRVPIVYLSAETDIALQMSALLRAGDDFVTKPLSDNALIATVFAHAQRARLLSNALARDSLTGLLKHGDIKERVALEVERVNRSGREASVVMLDIDHFKKVNDTYGHAAGDNVIRTLANLLRQRLRRGDGLGRYGGEEFLAILPDCSGAQAKRTIDDIRERFSALRFISETTDFSVTLSAGVAVAQAGLRAEQLRERADQMLYAAKQRGRNRVELE